MKKISAFIMVFIISIGSAGCSKYRTEDIYGTYIFKKVSYLSPFSSSTIDAVNQQMKGTEYTIEADLFKIDYLHDPIEVTSPDYIREKIPVDHSLLSDVRSFIGNDVKYQYTVFMNIGYTVHYRLYVSSDRSWISLYADNGASGFDTVMNIYELTKQQQ